MDDQRISYERSGISIMMTPIQSEAAHDGVFLRAANGTEEKDQLLTNKLLAVVSELIETMADALSTDRETAQDCVRHASAALLSCARAAHDTRDGSDGAGSRKIFRGGLAPWQVRSLSTYIDANLNTSLSCETLARLVRLSVSHFARAFKYTFGYSPHAFLMRRRMERAQGLMLKSSVPLAQIALECGLSDQAHLSRLFLQFTGESPASWRRARVTGSGERDAALR
jgi:AraC family transcriptional regulator